MMEVSMGKIDSREFEDEQKAREEAASENMQMIQGEEESVKGDDMCHIQCHMSFINDKDFKDFKPENKKRLLTHMKGHLDNMMGENTHEEEIIR